MIRHWRIGSAGSCSLSPGGRQKGAGVSGNHVALQQVADAPALHQIVDGPHDGAGAATDEQQRRIPRPRATGHPETLLTQLPETRSRCSASVSGVPSRTTALSPAGRLRPSREPPLRTAASHNMTSSAAANRSNSESRSINHNGNAVWGRRIQHAVYSSPARVSTATAAFAAAQLPATGLRPPPQ